MMDFYEGWELRNRLIQDGFLSPHDDISDGTEMDLKIEKLAREHYNWSPKEPTNEDLNDEYCEKLEEQTDSERLHHIWEIAIDYDGYRTYRGVAGLLDEVIACCQVKTKNINTILHEIEVFNQYETIDDFMNYHFSLGKSSFKYAFPIDKGSAVKKWCEENGYETKFLTFNMNEEGEIFAIALKIERKD